MSTHHPVRHLIVLLAFILPALLASQTATAEQRTAFLVPVPAEPSWQEFAYLAAVPATQAANQGTPAVVALGGLGLVPEEVHDYLDRYDPDHTYVIDCPQELPDPNEGLVSYWMLDETEGTTASDSAGSHDGTLVNDPVWTDGMVGGALEFDGTNQYVDCGTAPGSAADLSVVFWMRSDVDTGFHRPLHKLPATGTAGWGFLQRPSAEGNTLIFRIGSGDDYGGWGNECQTTEAYESGTWVHVAATFNSVTGTAKLYINGEPRSIKTGITGRGVDNTVTPLRLGGGEGYEFFDGRLDDVRIYDRVLSDVEILAMTDAQPDYTGMIVIDAGSPDEIACYLAQNHWTAADRVVLCDETDYEKALVASGLAARLEVPLLFFDGSAGLSPDALAVIADLGVTTALLVGQDPGVAGQLGSAGVSTQTLPDATSVLSWMLPNGLPVDYFAYANARDREATSLVPKLSLAAPLLAGARQGIVVPSGFDAVWQLPFHHDVEEIMRPPGAPDGDSWLLGSLSPGQNVYDFVVTVSDGYYLTANVDLNGNGNYGDPGEGPFSDGGEVEIDGKGYAVAVGLANRTNAPGDVKLTHPTNTEMQRELAGYHDILGELPEHLCIVGLHDAIPFGITDYVLDPAIDTLPTHTLIADTDSDPYPEIAVGRIVGENLLYGTLLATRSSTYEDLLHPEWADQALSLGGEANWTRWGTKQLENVGFEPPLEHGRSFVEEDLELLKNRSVITHCNHSDEAGWGHGPGYNMAEPEKVRLDVLLAPAVVETSGCLSAGIDMTFYDWDKLIVLNFLRKGAIAYVGSTRPATACYELLKAEFWNGISRGETLGQAWKRAQITAAYSHLAGVSPGAFYDDAMNQVVLYGDPGLRIHLPSEPIVPPARLDESGTTLTSVAPEWDLRGFFFWNEGTEEYEYIHTYYGPGIYPEYWDSAGNHLARWRTWLDVTELQQITAAPWPLGWPGPGNYFIDEHPDGTRSVYWRVRHIEYEWQTGNVLEQLDEIDYGVTTSSPGHAVLRKALWSTGDPLTQHLPMDPLDDFHGFAESSPFPVPGDAAPDAPAMIFYLVPDASLLTTGRFGADVILAFSL